VEKLPPLLPPSKRPHISIEKRDAYLRRRARAFFDPDGRHGLDDEWMVLHYLLLAEVPLRCRKVFRLFFVEQLKPEAIAGQLNIVVGTAKSDLVRALIVVSHEQREVEREGVVAKST
jgi:DNA-directed RNA polymerase specialized sigma24 family protein